MNDYRKSNFISMTMCVLVYSKNDNLTSMTGCLGLLKKEQSYIFEDA